MVVYIEDDDSDDNDEKDGFVYSDISYGFGCQQIGVCFVFIMVKF